MNFFRKCLIAVLRYFKKLLVANPKLRVLLYDLYNKEEFGNLYEHEKMLADSVRIENYKRAIQRQVRPGDIVLDLGTGTGILSFFAAQQRPEKIFAIDHSEFIGIAKKIAEQNNFENIEFVKTNSRNFNPDLRFDIIIHEQIGDYLFNENMIQNLLDLKQRLLKPGGMIIPGKFELFLEPACLVDSFRTPFIWENRLHGVDFSFLKDQQEILGAFKPAVYKQEWLEAGAVKHFLCEPRPVLSFDLNTLKSETEIPHAIEISKQVARPGALDSFCLFFKVVFDEEIQFDTSPFSANTHWGNCFFRMESRECAAGDVINCNLTMQDLLDIKTWAVSLNGFRERGSGQR